MTRCKYCGFFTDNTLSLGGCYCDPPKKGQICNLHEIESIQPMSLFDDSLISNRFLYKNEMEPYFPYATYAFFSSLGAYVRTFAHHDRKFRVWFKAGHDKVMPYNDLIDIMKKDNFEDIV